MLRILMFSLLLSACSGGGQVKNTEISAERGLGQVDTPKPAAQNTQHQEPPLLQLNPSGHLAKISDIAFTPDGRFLLSASNDKQIHVWDIEQQRIVRSLRGQIGAGQEGKIFAMALSPDGFF